MKKYLIILATSLLLWNCSEDKLPLYSGEHAVYFKEKEINFSFGLMSVMDSVVRVPVTSTGAPVGYDRHFRVVYDSVSGTPGTHFDPLPVEGIFPADSSTGYIPVKLRRVEGDDAIYEINLRLVANDEFSINLPEKYDQRDTIDVTRAKLTYSSAMTMPPAWVVGMFGYFSATKYVLFCELTGRDASFWSVPQNFSLCMALAAPISTYIDEKILAGRDHALRDPGNPNPEDKGFLTLRGAIYLTYTRIPDDWEPAN
ncbi:MAG: DUF4843 domain-containing protein [Odoribacteraceae bacterium]|jgi:hypothetical protein|nr:DUF4843 domain-containing protein [Odoribacteraceae bacterium]